MEHGKKNGSRHGGVPADNDIALLQRRIRVALGREPGDLLLTYSGADIASVDDLHRLLTGDRAGSETVIEILRQGRRQGLVVTPEQTS